MSLFRLPTLIKSRALLVTPVLGAVCLLSSCVTTTSVPTDGLEEGEVHRIRTPFARVYDVPNSTVFDKSSGSLPQGMEVKILSVTEREVEVETREGVTGFIDAEAIVEPQEKKPEEEKVDSEEKKKEKAAPPKKTEKEPKAEEKPVEPSPEPAVPSPEVKPLPEVKVDPVPPAESNSNKPGERLYPTTPEEAAAPAPTPIPPKPDVKPAPATISEPVKVTPIPPAPPVPAPKIRGADTSDLELEPIE